VCGGLKGSGVGDYLELEAFQTNKNLYCEIIEWIEKEKNKWYGKFSRYVSSPQQYMLHPQNACAWLPIKQREHFFIEHLSNT